MTHHWRAWILGTPIAVALGFAAFVLILVGEAWGMIARGRG